jgi:predicted nucleic acid-binding protein
VIVVDSSAWIDFFNGVSTPEVERLDGWLGVTPLAIGDLILVEVMQGFRTERDVATARQLFRSLALLPMLGGSNAWKAAENSRTLRRQGITVRKTIDGIIATACIEANLPLLFSDRDFQPYVELLGLEAA